MMKLRLLLLWIPMFIGAQSTPNLEYYLPNSAQYNTEIPTPKSIIGHQVGQWHITHDKLLYYMQTLAKTSERVKLENRGTTFEGRPLILLTITSPENHQQLQPTSCRLHQCAFFLTDYSFEKSYCQKSRNEYGLCFGQKHHQK